MSNLSVGCPSVRFAHGFCKGHSVATNAAPHVGKSVVIKLDIADCFPTIHVGRVRGLLIGYGYSYPVAQTLAVMMTEPPRQPVEVDGQLYHVPVGPRVCVQGAPTSPGLCNAILRRLDYRLAGLARKYGFEYTRYADDMSFSGHSLADIKPIVTIAARIAREEGLPLNRDKTRACYGPANAKWSPGSWSTRPPASHVKNAAVCGPLYTSGVRLELPISQRNVNCKVNSRICECSTRRKPTPWLPRLRERKLKTRLQGQTRSGVSNTRCSSKTSCRDQLQFISGNPPRG